MFIIQPFERKAGTVKERAQFARKNYLRFPANFGIKIALTGWSFMERLESAIVSSVTAAWRLPNWRNLVA
jgi:hypothetical protein